VKRPSLVHELDNIVAKLVLIDAPAGYGKTTLLAQWAVEAAARRPLAWISLGPGDNDPARLWQHLITSVQHVCPDLGADPILRSLHRQVPAVSDALSRLVNELSALAAPMVIVLDDYHLISERCCHDQLEFLLLRLPPTVQVILSTRAEPPLSLGKLRAAGEMAEIRMADLRFTAEQADALIQWVAAVKLSDHDLSELVERSEGWPAGLYLTALSLRDHPAPANFARDVTGGNRYIVDFLAEEVIGRQPEPIQQFLMRTAVLSRFTAPLCGAVTGTVNARDIIDKLERENLFLIALDDKREWFRYHHLFAQLLLGQLDRTEPGAIPALHQRASAWYLERGSADEAIGHALAAGDFTRSATLIAQHWYRRMDASRVATVCSWLRSLGDDNTRRLASVLLELDDHSGAGALLGAARDVLAAFPDGAAAQLDRLERLDRRLVRPPPARLPAEPLSERERAVLQLLRGTLSAREIGQELYVSANTVKSHTRAVYRKLGVSTRHDAVRRGHELGII
jgi:LuxR family maltose regulon positive regulatory protein